MAEESKNLLEREYTIPLKRAYLKVARYERSQKAIKEIKEFIAKHMKVPERNLNNVKIDVRFNNHVWNRGKFSPPSKVRVKAVKEGDIVKVTFLETPEKVKFAITRHEKRHSPSQEKESGKKEEKQEEKTEEQKKDESEKEKSVADLKETEIKQQSKAQKHTTKSKGESFHRMALQK